jgi:cytochrome P450
MIAFFQAESYSPLLAVQDGTAVTTLIALRPEARHTAVKRALGPIFTANAVTDYETYIDDTATGLTEKLKQLADGPDAKTPTTATVNLFDWLTYFAYDTLMRIGFDEDLGFMTHRRDIDGVVEASRDRLLHWHYWMAVPWLEKLLFRNPLFHRAANAGQSTLISLATRKVQERRVKVDKAVQQPVLLDKILAANESYPDIIDLHMVVGLSVSLLNAGAVTTAITMANTFHNLLCNPEKLAILKEELETASDFGAVPMKFADLNKLPYLDAVIKESMRLTPTSADMIERVTPPAGVTISGTFIPGGTTVSVSQHSLNRDPEIWGEDADIYDPDRWLRAEHKQRQIMERASIAFSSGKRVCTGQHIAWLEMKKLIPHLIQNFEVRSL